MFSKFINKNSVLFATFLLLTIVCACSLRIFAMTVLANALVSFGLCAFFVLSLVYVVKITEHDDPSSLDEQEEQPAQN